MSERKVWHVELTLRFSIGSNILHLLTKLQVVSHAVHCSLCVAVAYSNPQVL